MKRTAEHAVRAECKKIKSIVANTSGEVNEGVLSG
jgi:hypothetical protein